MSKILKFDEEALHAILSGVRTLAKAVIVTLGPKGRNVVIKKDFGAPLSTKDGVTVAKEIVLKDKFENMGAQLVKEASSKTCDVAGDGTTTAIVLAEAILSEGVKNVVAGASPMSVKRGIEKAVEAVIKALDEQAIKVSRHEEIEQVATISSNNDKEIGQLIAQGMAKVGKDGTMTISEAKSIETTLDVVEGLQFDKGYLSPYFVTNPEKMSVELSDVRILVTDQKLSSAKDLVPFLEKALEEGQKPILIIADDVEAEALATLVVNKLKAGLSVCAVKAPAFGDRRKEMLEDIAVLTGATLVTSEVGLKLEEVGVDVFGKAKTVKVTKEETTLVGGGGDAKKVESRILELRRQIALSSSDYDKEKLEERLAKLSGGVGVIYVGAATESELKEKKARVEDALHATKAAVLEGVVAGGGVALIRAAKALDVLVLEGEENVAIDIVKKACFAPAVAIAANCGEKGDVVAEKISQREGSFGFNGLTMSFEDLFKAGVIDPVLVTKSALKNAASVSALLITVAAMVTDKPEPKKKEAMPAHHGMDPMGGMGGFGGMM